MIETIRIEFLLQARSPISHGDKTNGNESLVRREEVMMPSGDIEEVPCVSGNAMRNGMRRAGTHALLEAAGLLDMELSEQAMLLLMNGGVQGGSGSVLRLDEYRELISLLPHIALLGGSTSNRIQEGQGYVDYAMLVCEETAHVVSPWVLEYAKKQGRKLLSCHDQVTLMQEVHGDASLSPGNRRRMLPGTREAVELRLSKSEAASEMNDAVESERNKSHMIPYAFEKVVRGSWWHWGCTFTCYDELDRDMLYVMLASFMANCVVGGKKRSGHGALEPIAAVNIDLPKWKPQVSEVDVTALAGRPGSVFRAHVSDRKDKIREILERIDADAAARSKAKSAKASAQEA